MNVDRRWLRRLEPGAPARVRLVCLPFAGGSAVVYQRWPRLLPDGVEAVAVQLPGRADRFAEPAHTRMASLVDGIVTAMGPLIEQPFALYGVSMGARVAWAVAHALRQRDLPAPRRLFVAASRAPCLDGDRWPWQDRADGLEGYVRDMGATPPQVLAEPELVAALLPTLRADLAVLSTDDHAARTPPLAVPIRAFSGTLDPDAGPDRMAGWRRETTAEFAIERVPGGHFFDAAGERQVVRRIGLDLLGASDKA